MQVTVKQGEGAKIVYAQTFPDNRTLDRFVSFLMSRPAGTEFVAEVDTGTQVLVFRLDQSVDLRSLVLAANGPAPRKART